MTTADAKSRTHSVSANRYSSGVGGDSNKSGEIKSQRKAAAESASNNKNTHKHRRSQSTKLSKDILVQTADI